MQKKPAKPSAPTPLFRQIVDDLKAGIVDGDLSEHAPLPSERTVAELHGVSRMTARRALEAVEAEGLAYSKDRKGRFVSPKRLDYNVSSMANFISDAAANGIEIEMDLLECRKIRAAGRMAEILSIPIGTPLFDSTRLFRRQGHATFLETETIIAERCADLLENATPGQRESPQEQRYSPLGHTADFVMRMRALDPDEAELLGLMPYQAGIEHEQLVRDRSGDAFCLSRQIWRGEMARFSGRAMLAPVGDQDPRT